MEITTDTLRSLAGLTKIALTQAEEDRLSAELGALIRSAARIASLDVEGVEPTTHGLPVGETFFGQYREDRVAPPLPREDVLAGAPECDETCFLVPKILE